MSNSESNFLRFLGCRKSLSGTPKKRRWVGLVENGIDVTFVQELLGHNDVRTTLRYMHVSQKKINQIESPLDRALRKMEEQKNGDEKTN